MQTEIVSSEVLCGAYWHRLYGFVRSRGYASHDAQDLTQEFFARALEHQTLKGAARKRGSPLSYLLTALKWFLANEWHRQQCLKRGGGSITVPLDAPASKGYPAELVERNTPATLWDRQWALSLLDRALDRLREEYAAAGKTEHFERLRVCLPGAERSSGYADLAAAVRMSEAAVRMAACRLRRRYGELVRDELAASGFAPEEIDEAIQALMAAISDHAV